MELTKKQKKQILYIIFAVVILTGFAQTSDWASGRDIIKNGIVRGDTKDSIYEESFVAKLADGSRQNVVVKVYPKQIGDEQCQQLLEQAVQEFEACYLGENDTADVVRTDLMFPADLCEGMVQGVYESDTPDRVWEDGSVETEGVVDEGQLVKVKCTFSCQESQLEYNCYVRIRPKILSESQQKEKLLGETIARLELESRDMERFVLPDTIEGEPIRWQKERDTSGFVFVLLGVVAIICVLKKSQQEEQKRRVQHTKALAREYPQMVTQLSLLMGAGMTLSSAWERMIKRYLETQAIIDNKRQEANMCMEEMLITYREIKEGKSIKKAYEDFGSRTKLPRYRKLSALLVQNIGKGTRDIVQVLDAEVDEAIEEQKRMVRKQGEEAGTKLLFPMMLLLLMILIVIMMPATQSF